MLRKYKYNPMNDNILEELLEYAFKDEAKGIEFYTDLLNSIPIDDPYYKEIIKTINKIRDQEQDHLTWLAQLIDRG
jgi:rubrerythrin